VTDTFSLSVGESIKSKTGLEESTEEAELNLKPGELLRGVKDLLEVARDEVKLGIFSCEEGFLNGLMSFHTTSAIPQYNWPFPLSALLYEIVKSINCVYIERREACNNTSNISANQI
jgi:hypothetical protein